MRPAQNKTVQISVQFRTSLTLVFYEKATHAQRVEVQFELPFSVNAVFE
jgi:hypothetical protein